LKKRSKKLLLVWANGGETSVVKNYKSFFAPFLFTKKKTLPLRPPLRCAPVTTLAHRTATG
jgi:hypothetical protein